jgi:signal transduction histidine kinase
MDAQWVEVRGVIRRCLEAPPVAPADTDIWRLVIAMDGGNVFVGIPTPKDPRAQVDAEVRLCGICLYRCNQKRQVLTPVLKVPTGVPIRLEKEAPTNPFAAPVRAADSLLLFAPENVVGHRIHVQGVVTCAQPGISVWIRDSTAGLRIQTDQDQALQPGDELDVLGFPVYGRSSLVLEDASFRKTGHRPPPPPLTITNFNAAFDHEYDLLVTEAKLTGIQPTLGGAALTLDLNGAIFKAVVQLTATQPIPPEWQPGSKVRITGICSIAHDEFRTLMGIWHPQTFQIQLRSPDDLKVIVPPPWWTYRHINIFLGAAAGGLLLAISLVALFARRRLREQNHQRLMAEREFAAILSERNRLAREIHDTLAQGLVATSVQLQLAKKQVDAEDRPLNQHLDTAQQLVRGSLEEARNSIWNMRSQILEAGDLASALTGILKQMAEGTELKTALEIIGRPRRLAPVFESNLLRIGQEAITNAVRHAQAKQITVKMEFGEKQFQLIVTDDGRGFDSSTLPRRNGGFGLMGLRERTAELKGELNIRSSPGHGSEIIFCLPLSGE